MREIRLGGGFKEHYSSFEEMAKAYGHKLKKKNENKTKELQDKFCAKYRCTACGQPMGYIGGGLMTCMNDKCKGIKIERENREGNKTVTYDVSYKYVKDYDVSYANYIFS